MTGLALGIFFAAVPAAIAAVLGVLNRGKLTAIHVLVNSRLDQALSEIADLRRQRDIKHSETVSSAAPAPPASPASPGRTPG